METQRAVRMDNVYVRKMMPRDLATYIRLPGIFEKLDPLRVKENSAINLVLKYMKKGHLDDEMKSLIAINHNF